MRYSCLIKKYNNQNFKKNSNNDGGYTLVELLAIIAVLSLVIITIVVFYNNILDSSFTKMDKITENSIIDAAVNFSIEYRTNDWWKEDVNDATGDISYCVSLNTLLDYGYFDNSDNNYDKWKDTYIVDVSIVNGVYDYKLKKIEDSRCVFDDFESIIKDSEKNYEIKDDSNEEIGKFVYNLNKINDKEYSFGYTLDLDLVSVVEDLYVNLVVDRSSSMVTYYDENDVEHDYPEKYENAKNAAISFSDNLIKNFSGNSYISLIQYDKNPELRRDFENQTLNDSDFRDVGSGTNLAGGLDLAISLMCSKGLDIDSSDSKWCDDIYTGEKIDKNIKLYTILFFDGASDYISYFEDNDIRLDHEKIKNDDAMKHTYFKNFMNVSLSNEKTRGTDDIRNIENFLTPSVEYLKNNLDSNLFMVGYDYWNRGGDIRSLATNDDKLCENGYVYNGKTHCYYNASVENVDTVLNNILNNIIVNSEIDSVKFNLKPRKFDGDDMITLLKNDDSKVDNNLLEIKYNDLEQLEEDFHDSINDYKFLINDFMYNSCSEYEEEKQCKLENVKLFDVTLDIMYKDGNSNSILIDSPEFDLSLINVNTLN